jgi:hypothetical protein
MRKNKKKNVNRIIAQLVRKYGYPAQKLTATEYETVLREAQKRTRA